MNMKRIAELYEIFALSSWDKRMYICRVVIRRDINHIQYKDSL